MSTEQRLRYITQDVFTDKAYTGNQLAIVRVPASVTLSQWQKQKLAQEFNFSETVILHDAQGNQSELERDIDIFLKDAEIPFAGHPTVGTACFIGSQQSSGDAEVKGVLKAKAGPISFVYSPASGIAEISIPHDSFVHPNGFSPKDLASYGFPQQITDNAPQRLPFVSIVKGVTFCLIQLPSVEVLGRLSPTVRLPRAEGLLDPKWHPADSLAAYMFYVDEGHEKSAEGSTRVLRTRMIAGSFEDPATGAASAALAVYLALHDSQRDKTTPGDRNFRMVQGVEMGRRSTIIVEVAGDQKTSNVNGVKLKGSAVQVMEGSLIVPS